jgi:hypothetical protein
MTLVDTQNIDLLKDRLRRDWLDDEQRAEAAAMLNNPEAITAEQVLLIRQRADDIISPIHETNRIRELGFIAEMAWRACHETPRRNHLPKR